LFGFVDLIERLAQRLPDERRVNPFAAQFLSDPVRAVTLALSARERPIACEAFVVQIIEGAKFFDRRIGGAGRVAAAVEIPSNFRFAARTARQITQGDAQRICFRAGWLDGAFVFLSSQNKL
jgi:hypothetical protein